MTIYADTDLFLALTKKNDWLKSAAQKALRDHKGEVTTSIAVVIELALVAKREGYPVTELLTSIFAIADVRGISMQEAIVAGRYIDSGFTVFDSFHAALAGDLMILSSDKAYVRMGKRTIAL